MPDLLLPYLAVIAVLTITPGPDMLLALRNGLRGGPEAAWATGLGCSAGIAVHALLAVLGLSAILAASDEAFTVVRVAGAAYLVLLGVQAIAGSFTRSSALDAPGGRETGSPFQQGLITNLLNPKMALLFLTLLPQFVADGEPRVATTAVLAAIFLAGAVAWWRAFSLAVGPLGRLLSRPRVVAWFDRGTGALLVGLGLRVALERR
ncbi:MAG TPA: LysE family translocator [Thermoleophilaceae bacterium]|jgi:threonine/homoserine/homoserine lactone efflux protein